MRFFLDNCLPPRLAKCLHVLSSPEHSVTHLRQKFDADVSDPVWIGALSKEGNWVLISADKRITRNPQNRAAWLKSGLTGFFLDKGWSNKGFDEQAWRLVRWWPDIVRGANMVKPGAGFIVHPTRFGKLEQLTLR